MHPAMMTGHTEPSDKRQAAMKTTEKDSRKKTFGIRQKHNKQPTKGRPTKDGQA